MYKSIHKILWIVLMIIGISSCNSNDDETRVNFDYTQYGSTFTNMPDKKDAIIYQVNIRAFSNEGTLNGVRAKLSHIKELGANVVYLMPIYPIGELNGVGSPYAVKNYKEVNPNFGTLDDLKTLVEEAHSMDMAVILDWVANHTAWDNPWISQHPDWYMQDESGNIVSPPNTVYTDVAQLDFNNQEMKDAMIDAMAYWVYNANVDGFRCDYADAVPQNFWTEAVTAVRGIKNQNMLMLAEGTDKSHFDAGFDYTFGFNFFSALEYVFGDGEPATRLQDSNTTEYEGNYNEANRVVRYTTNHDVNLSDGTPYELFNGKEGSMAAFVVAAYMKSVPMIYNGQEVGYNQRIDYFNDDPIDWSSADNDLYETYKSVINFRKSSMAIKVGSYNGYSTTNVAAFTMTYNNETVLVIANLRGTNTTYLIPEHLKTNSWTNALNGGSFSTTNQVQLAPYEYIILQSNN